MNREEAKNILQLCRPDCVEDLDDTLFTEAFEQLEQDSALCAWFEDQQMIDAEIASELCRIIPEPELKKSILKGMRQRFEVSGDSAANEAKGKTLSDKGDEPVSDDVSNRLKITWFRPLIGMAAVLLFTSALLVLTIKQPKSNLADKDLPANAPVASSQTNVAGIPDVIQFLGNQIADFNDSKFDKRSDQVNQLQSHLAQSGMPNPTVIPSQLQTAPTIGCVTFDYNGTKMSMICFKNGKVYHLITVNKMDLQDTLLPNNSDRNAQFFEHREQAFKVWSEGNQIYIICTKGTKEDIPEFI